MCSQDKKDKVKGWARLDRPERHAQRHWIITFLFEKTQFETGYLESQSGDPRDLIVDQSPDERSFTGINAIGYYY